MKKIADVIRRIYLAARYVLGRYPAAYAAVLNIAVALVTYFGFNVTKEQLVYVIGVATAFTGAYVHARVKPLAKAKDDKGE